MIKSFGSKETERIWKGEQIRQLPLEVQITGRRKLRMINNAFDINDLRIPPANRLEKLSGNLSGYYSIRINKQWRIVFQWHRGNALNVEIVDYH
jgi:proteic killer suppression protein